MGPRAKATKKKVSPVVSKVNDLAAELEKSNERTVRFSAERLRGYMDGNWKKKAQMYFPAAYKKKVAAMVEAIRAEGHDVYVRPMRADPSMGISEKDAAKYTVIVITGNKIGKSTAAAVPTRAGLLTDVERNLLYPYFHKNNEELNSSQKMTVLEDLARKVNRNSSQTSLEEFDLVYRGVQDAIRQNQNSAETAKLRKRFGSLVPLWTEVKKKMAGENADLPAPQKIVPVKSPGEPKAVEAGAPTEHRAKPKSKIQQLRDLLAQGEPASANLKAARYKKLMEFYQMPGFKKWIAAKYVSLMSSLVQAGHKKDADLSRQDREKFTREVKELESYVALYQETYRQLIAYAPDNGAKAKIEQEQKSLGLKRHKELMKYVSSQTAMMNEVAKLRLTRSQEQPIYDHLGRSLDPRYSPRAQVIDLGTGSSAKKKAEALAKILRKYPQLMLLASTVRVSRYYSKGKEGWVVELGTAEECSRKRAAEAINRGENVPLEAADFRDRLPRIYAERMGDAGMDSADYAKAYEQLNALSTGNQQRYNITLPNKVAAGELYSVVWAYGIAHGFSAADLQQKGKEWVVSIICPKEATPAPAKADAEAGAAEGFVSDPMTTVIPGVTDATATPKEEATASPIEGTRDLALSAKTINWLSRHKMSPAKFQKQYNAQMEKYNKLNSGEITLKKLNKLLDPAQACADLTEAHLAALEANMESFKEDLSGRRFLKGPSFRREVASYEGYVAHIKKLHRKNLEDLEEIQKRVNYLENASPEKVSAVPAAIEGRNTHLARDERVAAVSAYKNPGASWSYKFDEARHAQRVYDWLMLTNFEPGRVVLAGKVLKINGPELPKKAKAEASKDGSMIFSTAVVNQERIQEMVDSIYAWADPEASKFLQNSTRTTASGKTHQQILDSFATHVNEEQLSAILDYINYETYLLSHGMPPSGERFELIISNTADSTAVMEGIKLLYVAAGLDTPPRMFHKVSVNASQGGNQQIRVRGLPQAYVRPLKDFSLPELKGGYLFLPDGEQVYLSMEQKQQIEAALRNGKGASLTIYKDAKEKQVDTAGAAALMYYLQSRGWTNVGVQAWNPQKKVSAHAAIAIYEVPPGYWERPSILSAIEGRNILLDAELLREKVEERSRTEMDSLMISSEGETPTFSIPENGVMNIGSMKVSILDRLEGGIAAAKAGGKAHRDHIRLEEKRIAQQKKEIERAVNTPGAAVRITFNSFSRATAASEVVQGWLRSQADMRVVKVEKGAVFRKIPYTRNYYLVIRNPSRNAFEDRFETPMLVPASYRYVTSSGGRVQAPLLASTMDRVRLELFLNGHGGQRADFYMTTENEEVLRAYLSDSGFNMGNMETVRLKSASEIPNEFRQSLGTELGGLLSQTLLSGEVKYVRVSLAIPQEEIAPAEINEDSNRARYSGLTLQLYGRDDELLRNYYASHPKVIRTILNYARNPEMLKKESVIRISRKEWGPTSERIAERLYFAIDASGLFPGGVRIVDGHEVVISPSQQQEQGPMGRRGYHAARMEHAAEITNTLLGSMLPEAQQESRKLASGLLAKGDEKYEVNFAVGERVSTMQAFQNRLAVEEGTDPFSTFYGLFSDSMQQYIFDIHTSENKTAYSLGLFNLDMKQSEEKAAKFDSGPAIVIMEGFLRMHSGFGLGKDWATRRPKYARRAREMYEVLSTYRNFDEFAKAIGINNPGAGAATAIHQYANIMTRLAVSNNTSYSTWSKTKQKAYEKAVFDVMWRSITANYLFESGPVLGLALAKEKKAMYEEYRGLMVDYFTGMGENSKFTHNGKEYFTLQSLVVRSNGDNLLCVPIKGKGPRAVLAVEGRRLRKTAAGNFVWERTEKFKVPRKKGGEKGKEKGKEKWVDQMVIHLNNYDSLGALGVTGAHSGPVFQLEGDLEPVPEKPAGGVDKGEPGEPEIKYVETTMGQTLLPIVPITYVGPTYTRFTTEAVWEYRKRNSPLVLGMAVPKEMLFKNVKDPRLGTITTDIVPVTLKGGKKGTITFILPPRHRYNKKREREEDYDYPANVFKGRYASAYVWNNSVYVIDYASQKDVPEDPLEQVPLNARQLYSDTNEELKEKGFVRINIGRFDSGTGTIAFRKKEYEKYADHIFGQALLSSDMLKEMTDEEADKFFKESSGTRYSGFRYYSFVPPREGEDDTGASEEVVGGELRRLQFIHTKIIEGVGGSIPPAVLVGKKRTKKVPEGKR